MARTKQLRSRVNRVVAAVDVRVPRQPALEDAQLVQALAASRAMMDFEETEFQRAIRASEALAQENEALESAIAQSIKRDCSDGNVPAVSCDHQSHLGSKLLSVPTSSSASNALASSRCAGAGNLPTSAYAAPVLATASTDEAGLAAVLRASALADEAEKAALAQAIAASLALDDPKPMHSMHRVAVADVNSGPVRKSDAPIQMSTQREDNYAISARNAEATGKGSLQTDAFEAAQFRAAEIEGDVSADWLEEEEEDWLVVEAVDEPGRPHPALSRYADLSGEQFSIATPPGTPRSM